jgi:protein-tyrosine-phosphatase
MAEAMLNDKVAKNASLKGTVAVYSCGTDAEDHSRATYAAIETMRKRGIDLSQHRSTNIYHSRIYNSTIEDMDLILCAETYHKNFILNQFPKIKERKNVYTLKEYVKNQKDLNIDDPYGMSMDVYEFCASEIEDCLDKLVLSLKTM